MFCKWGGSCASPNPPLIFFARSNALPSYSMFCRSGGLRPPQPPRSYLQHRIRRQDLAALSRKRHVLAKPNKAQQEATCYHLIRCFANGGRLRPPQPPAFFLGQLLSKQIFARLSKKWRFAILFDVLQMGGAAPPPNPPAHIYSTAFAGAT